MREDRLFLIRNIRKIRRQPPVSVRMKPREAERASASHISLPFLRFRQVSTPNSPGCKINGAHERLKGASTGRPVEVSRRSRRCAFVAPSPCRRSGCSQDLRCGAAALDVCAPDCAGAGCETTLVSNMTSRLSGRRFSLRWHESNCNRLMTAKTIGGKLH
jgi:hypothetical protein